LDQLEPLRDTAANVDLLGRPVACARFMAGREYAAIAGVNGGDDGAQIADVEALVAAGTMALPSFTPSGGPFPGTGGKGQIVGPPPGSERARAALARLYLALITSACLDLLRSRGEVIIDGPLADDRLFTGLLAALCPGQPIAASNERHGAALGAALLWGWSERTAPAPLDLRPVAAPRIAGLAAYERRWRAAAEAAGLS
jgi:L-fuculokinase